MSPRARCARAIVPGPLQPVQYCSQLDLIAHAYRTSQHDPKGKVTGARYADKNGAHQVQKARIVCVAGNSIESPRLLLNSASNLFKDGMANSSGQVGRNYTRHATQHVYATFDRPVHAHSGIHAPGIMRSEGRHDPSRGFAGADAIFQAGNAKDVVWRAPFPNSHNMGSVRMSANRADGVCNRWGQTHDIKNLFASDGSQFASSGACNPTLTIVAFAIRQAEYIHNQMGAGTI